MKNCMNGFLRVGLSLEGSADLIDAYAAAIDILQEALARATSDAGREKIARAELRLGQQFQSQLFQRSKFSERRSHGSAL